MVIGIRYIGSKARVADEIARIVGRPVGNGAFVDGFCGTGTVAEAIAAAGWSVRLNDHLLSSALMAAARLIGEDSARFDALGGYSEAVARPPPVMPCLRPAQLARGDALPPSTIPDKKSWQSCTP